MEEAKFVISLITMFVLISAWVFLSLWASVRYATFSRTVLDLYRNGGGRCFWTGLLNLAVSLLLIVLLIKTQVLGWLGLLLAAAVAVLLLHGLGAAFQFLGLRMLGREPKLGQPDALAHITGGGVAAAAFFVPFLGQLTWLYVATRGIGASTLALWAKRNRRNQADVVSAVTEEATQQDDDESIM